MAGLLGGTSRARARVMQRLAVLVLSLIVGCGGGAPDRLDGGPDSPSDAGTAGATDSAIPDAGMDMEPDAPAPPAAAPIVAPPRTWTWVEVEGTRCALGGPAGLGINPVEGAERVVVYLDGGGYCVDAWDPEQTVRTSYESADLGRESALGAGAASPIVPLDRDNPSNPFRDATLVFVPYCTCDVHGGSASTTESQTGGRTAYFWGARNLEVMLSRLNATIPSGARVWLVGTSAGGIGATLNHQRATRLLGRSIDVVVDSGVPLDSPGSAVLDAGARLWDVEYPCSGCTSLGDVDAYNRASAPGARFGYLSFYFDATMASAFGYGRDMTGLIAFNRDLLAFGDSVSAATTQNRYFWVDYRDPRHVVLTSTRASGGAVAAVSAWLADMAEGRPWSNQTVSP